MSEGDTIHKKCLKCGAELTNLSAHNCGQCGANQDEFAKEQATVLKEALIMATTAKEQPPVAPQVDSHDAPQAQPFSAAASPKQGQTALLLCVTLGMVGAHRFYVGKIGSALLLALAPLPTVLVVMAILFSFGQAQLISGLAFSAAVVLLAYALVGAVVLRDLIHISSAKFTDKQGQILTF